MDKETALKVLMALIEHHSLILKPSTTVSIEEYNKQVVDTIRKAYERLISAE